MSRRLLAHAKAALVACAGMVVLGIGVPTPPALADMNPAETWALHQLQAGEVADLANDPDLQPSDRSLSATFIEDLLTNRTAGVNLSTPGVRMANANIVGKLELTNTDIAYDFSLTDSRLTSLTFTSVHFQQNVVFDRDIFDTAQLERVTVDGNASFSGATFGEPFAFRQSVVAGQLSMIGSEFDSDLSLDELSTKRALVMDNSTFLGTIHLVDADLYQLQARDDHFNGDFDANGSKVTKRWPRSGSCSG